jgi:hypothetical protein
VIKSSFLIHGGNSGLFHAFWWLFTENNINWRKRGREFTNVCWKLLKRAFLISNRTLEFVERHLKISYENWHRTFWKTLTFISTCVMQMPRTSHTHRQEPTERNERFRRRISAREQREQIASTRRSASATVWYSIYNSRGERLCYFYTHTDVMGRYSGQPQTIDHSHAVTRTDHTPPRMDRDLSKHD